MALIQFAITGGAFLGGLLFDAAGWSSSFLLAAGLLCLASLLAVLAVRALRRS